VDGAQQPHPGRGVGRDLTAMAPPGQNTLSRARRLKSAKRWLATYRGKNLVRGYKKRFRVDDVCAVLELRMLGADLPDARLEQARRDEQSRTTGNARRKQKHARQAVFGESDKMFAFIAGYTEGGAPYGITREEIEALDAQTETPRGRAASNGRDVPRVNGIPVMDDDESLPF
jgi:hypothetical protein